MITGRIYSITNLFNGTRYVGQTTQSLEERYKTHCIDAKKERNKNRKLYCAMNEFGYGSFKIEEIEAVENEEMLDIREIFWIKQLRTFENGYNETKGGKGSLIYNHEEIIKLYQDGKTISEISDITGSEESNIRKIFR